MNFKCNKTLLQESINVVQKAITGKSTMPVLSGILIQANKNILTFIGSDIDLSIETKIEADVYEEGSIVVDSKLFGDIIRKLPNDTVEIFTEENNILNIVCQKSNFSLLHMNPDDFPEIPNIDEKMIFTISQKILKNMIRGTIFAIAQDETRPILTGVLFEIKNNYLNLVALDGYRLALKKEYVENDSVFNAVIPGKTLNEVSKIFEDSDKPVNITFTNNQILFNLGNTKVVSRLLEGEFIKYESIIPEEHNTLVKVKRSEILECVERASLLAKDGNTNLIKFDIFEDNLIITSNSQLGKVREEINIVLQGENLKIAFNSRYLIELLKIMEKDEIQMEFSSSVSPCIIKNSQENSAVYLVLPVRLSDN